MNLDVEIRKYALQNAIKFSGRANPGAVIGKLLSTNPELKTKIKDIAKQVNKIIKEISKLSLEEQTSQLQELAPELLEKKKKESKKELPKLKNAENGKVITRIPPEPSKYAHIGHAMSFLINYLYAKKYNGKCLLKFEDTNPEKCTKEFADAMEEDIIGYLGIKPDKIIYISDDMDYMIQKAEELIKKNKAYVCFCDREKMQDLRHKGKECECRAHSAEKNTEEWDNMKNRKHKEGKAVLRLKGNMESDNHVMRDPVLFRINYTGHFRQKNKYCVWPMYDFENPVEDCKYEVTHIMRSSEFGKMRNELQNFIKELFGWEKQTITHYGRININGSISSGREIRKLIEEGKVSGWDDPSLVTLKALKRRGIVKEALYELVHQVGMSLAPTNIDWTVLSTINRHILDPEVNRYFFIQEPIKIQIKNSPEQKLKLKQHPDFPERGTRIFKTHDRFYIEKKDYNDFKDNSLNRLMDCLNFTKEKKGFAFHSTEYGKFKDKGKKIIHWLPVSDNLTNVEIRMPDNEIIKGLGESNLNDLKQGEIIQFQRFGFCRLDKKNKDKLEFWFTHK
ncbi:glutamate--tRNA ligase [Candidatus Woesearchaeota archaeon]|nr:glutamate--tRNA ligase [Candidatus Woesearchaeota archaeon]